VEANLSFMANEESESSKVSSSTFVNFENYSQLFYSFIETHEEANRLTLLNNWLKGLNNWLENRVKTLKEELSHSKTNFENMEMIYQNFFYKCVDSSFCENCDSLQKKVYYLLKKVERFSKGQSNIVSQNCIFGKAGLRFNINSKNKPFSKPFFSFFEKQPIVLSKQPAKTCFY